MRTATKIALWSAAAAAVGGASIFTWWKLSDPHRLAGAEGSTTTTNNICTLNQDQYFGFAGWNLSGDDPIRFTGAHLTRVPTGMVVKGIYAVSATENPRNGILGVGGIADWQKFEPGVHLHPISDVVMHPHSRSEAWWLVAVVQQTKPGHVQDGGITIDYTADGRSGSTTYHYISALNCS